jgi:hypothetical protein
MLLIPDEQAWRLLHPDRPYPLAIESEPEPAPAPTVAVSDEELASYDLKVAEQDADESDFTVVRLHPPR